MSTRVWPSWLPLSKNLLPLSPYGAPQVQADAVLNTNENPYAPSSELSQAIGTRIVQVASTLNRYPDRDAVVLRTRLAGFINELSATGFTERNIWAANGSNEIIQSLFLAFGSKGALGFTPSYSMHPLIATVTSTQWSDGGRRSDFTLDPVMCVSEIKKIKPSITFITTPNNPTGTSVSLADIEEIAKATAEVSGLLIIDEAYAEFSEAPSAVTLIPKYPHLVVIRTMSKAFAFAGARLGYLVADHSVVEAMFLVRLPYHLSSLTQAASEVALEFKDELLRTVATLKASRDLLVQSLESMGLRVIPSDANFILFTGFKPDAPTLWKKLLNQGVLIRDVGLSGYLRVTIGTEDENKRFLQELSKCLE